MGYLDLGQMGGSFVFRLDPPGALLRFQLKTIKKGCPTKPPQSGEGEKKNSVNGPQMTMGKLFLDVASFLRSVCPEIWVALPS